MDRSDLALRGLNDYASTGSGPTRQSDARDSELRVSVDVTRGIALITVASFQPKARRVPVGGRKVECEHRFFFGNDLLRL